MAEGTDPNVNAGGKGTQTGTEGQKQTFEELLADKEYQSEFDKRVAKALETAKEKWQTEFNTTLDTKVKEANKLAKMTADEKAKFEREKQEEYNKRLSEVTKRELKAEAKEQLINDGLPAELADALNYTDAESCKSSMESVKKAFAAAVEKAVNDKIRGKSQKEGGTKTSDVTKEQFEKMTYSERL